MAAPLQRSEPEPDWTAAHEEGVLPDAVMELYRRAQFLSFGAAPPFLNDSRRHLFSYFGSMLRGLKESLKDAAEELAALEKAESLVFDRGKELRGEHWTPDAPRQSKKHFRLLMLSLCSALDCSAEFTALILPGAISGLRVGRAEFAHIETWLLAGAPQAQLVATPGSLKAVELYRALRPLVVQTGEAKDWLSLLRLYRNKAAHLGSEHFREMGFHDTNRVFYTFLPTKWPVIWEEHIKLHDPEPTPTPLPIQKIFGPLMLQDKISFLKRLQELVERVVSASVSVLNSASAEFHDFAVDQRSIEGLEKSIRQYAFKAFP